MPDAMPDATPDARPAALPDAALALFLVRQAAERERLIGILRGAGRLDRVARIAAAVANGVEVITLPAPDVLPYDLVPPSPAVVGRRVRALTALAAKATGPRLLLTSATGALLRVRPAVVWRDAALRLRVGDRMDEERFRAALAQRGYRWDERIDEPGEVALRGQVIDLFPAGEPRPVRLQIEEGRIRGIVSVDPVTLRSIDAVASVVLRPATEYRIDPEAMAEARALLEPDADPEEHQAELKLPRRLVPVFDLLPDAAIYRDPETGERWRSVRDAIDDAYDAARKAGRVTGGTDELPPPERLFLTLDEVESACAERVEPGPDADGAAGEAVEAPRRIDELITLVQEAGADRVLIATPADAAGVAASLRKRGLEMEIVGGLAELAPGAAGVFEADLAAGLRAPGLLLLPIGQLLRPRAGGLAPGETDAPRVGETVVHLDYGVCRLTGLRTVGGEDRLALEFADGIEKLVAPDELTRIWRYGEGGRLDRLGGEGWRERRGAIEAELGAVAAQLATQAAARAAATAPELRPPADKMATVTRRFPFPPSRDQRAAIRDVTDDLASGRPMDRLLCGDVGFGKTEVAIRAAAAAAFAGFQVVIAAPTTVLARQHHDTFRARFEGTGLHVAAMMRAGSSPANRAVRDGLRHGAIDIVIGTQGLAGVRLGRPGLVVIDEEQRFGEGDKARLAGLAPHVLSMTATPIPRTMQAALAGLREVSVLQTPPQDRQPTRTFVLAWDPIVVREALLREKRRGGQSFVVCPRIADLAAVAARLAELAPDLSVVQAHGRMAPETLEAAVLGFAEGAGDVLLATNIIEAGLDIPRANLILVTKADRFGLAQLHQLRGRVGRSTRRGTAYFLTEPGRRLTGATQRRLATMEALSTLGAGIAVSAADLELRGAGDLLGEQQAGHVRAVGTELYQHLLLDAVARQRGDAPEAAPAELHTELCGSIPADYVPEENLRIELLRRLSAQTELRRLRAFTVELEDRFGPLPDALGKLVALQRLRIACRLLGIARVDAGPEGCALTLADASAGPALANALDGDVKNDRVILKLIEPDPLVRTGALADLLVTASAERGAEATAEV